MPCGHSMKGDCLHLSAANRHPLSYKTCFTHLKHVEWHNTHGTHLKEVYIVFEHVQGAIMQGFHSYKVLGQCTGFTQRASENMPQCLERLT